MYCLLIVTAYHLLQISSTLSPTSKNVCPRNLPPVGNLVRNTSKDALTVECCPNFIEKNGICEPCPVGTYGKFCINQCELGSYGIGCNSKCNCSTFQECHNIFGCVCQAGFTGNRCDKECPSGHFGVNCTGQCECPYNAVCDPINGTCSCPIGYLSPRCEACPEGKFGSDCERNCNCSTCNTCDNVTGNCTCNEQSSASEKQTTKKYKSETNQTESSHLITVYIGMASALLVLVCIVAAIVRIKRKVCRFMRSIKRKGPKMKLQIRKNIPTKSEGHTQNESVESCSSNLKTHTQPFLCELDNGYCEISEVSVSNHTRQVDLEQINSTSKLS
ncbi:unnamed protein product [Mytilus coruscus]|uniref:Laminin EGF-like domain-containing protein n=1 Tax=Mytilus coruscus TaxID=42192 RepID=A0A6J8DTM6_MYTCO|nr:unnamed protein product [Mytilus coruscus]